jgi:hypothetical protein
MVIKTSRFSIKNKTTYLLMNQNKVVYKISLQTNNQSSPHFPFNKHQSSRNASFNQNQLNKMNLSQF